MKIYSLSEYKRKQKWLRQFYHVVKVYRYHGKPDDKIINELFQRWPHHVQRAVIHLKFNR